MPYPVEAPRGVLVHVLVDVGGAAEGIHLEFFFFIFSWFPYSAKELHFLGALKSSGQFRKRAFITKSCPFLSEAQKLSSSLPPFFPVQ